MKRLWAVLVSVMVLWSSPVDATAQGASGSSAGAGAGAISSQPSGNACGNDKGASSSCWGTTSLYAGWLETSSNGNSWALRRTSSTGTAAWPLKGFWLEASQDVNLNHDYGLILSGGVLQPRTGHGTWFNAPSGQPVDFTAPSYDWWQAQGLLKRRVSGPVDILAGVRWRHINTKVNYNDNTTDDYVLNTYTPLIGVQVNKAFSASSLLVRFVASPLTRGTLKYNFSTQTGFSEYADFDVTDGSFMEFLASYGLKLKRDLTLGAFVKGSSFETTTPVHNLSGSTSEPVSWDVDLRSWTFGGTVSWRFGS